MPDLPVPAAASDDHALRIYRHGPPHWRMRGAIYFVNWRLRQGQADLAPEERTLVVDALRCFDGQRYELVAWVVMNDHVHVLVQPLGDHALEKIVQSWKSYTAAIIQKRRGQRGALWQRDYYDRIIRNEAELRQKAGYIFNNPVERWPGLHAYEWVGGTAP